jgi:hypothetical protein
MVHDLGQCLNHEIIELITLNWGRLSPDPHEKIKHCRQQNYSTEFDSEGGKVNSYYKERQGISS